MSKFDFDLIIIGGGSAGLVSSKLAAGMGKSVAIIEKNKLGGECTWTGCVPSKAIIKSAFAAHTAKTLSRYGITQNSNEVDCSGVMESARSIREAIYSTHTPEILKIKDNITTISGSPYFIDQHTIKIDDKKLTASRFIIATGSRPFTPPIKGIDTITYHTNETIFELDAIPSSLIILGGGPIGIELGSAFNRLGCKVTIIEMNDKILPREDSDLALRLQEHLKSEGVIIKTGFKAESVTENNTIFVTCSNKKNKTETFEAEKFLIATGRSANIENLGLEELGIKTERSGVMVNKYLQSSCKNIYACGDVVGPYLFSHMAEYQAVIATKNALLPWPIRSSVDPEQKIWVTFSDPELATCGMSEEQARKKFRKIYVYQQEVKNLDRAKTDREHVGVAKFICTSSGQLIGATILAPRAGELIHEAYVIIRQKKKLSSLFGVVHAYPCYNDLIRHAAKKAYVDEIQRNIFIRLASKFFKK